MKAPVFDFPGALHYFVDHDMWANFEADGSVRVGITSLGVALSGDVYMCRVKALGEVVEQGRGLAVVELSKAIVSVKSPLSGVIVERNEWLEDRPELVNADPYGAGWLARVRPDDWPRDALAMVSGSDVAPAMAHRLALMQPELKR